MSVAPVRVVVFGIGNESRGDDALGPLLLRRLDAARLPQIRAIEEYQLQIENALDLDDADLALFIDAGTGTPAPFSFYEIEPDRQIGHSTHALAPEAVLAVHLQVQGKTPPPAFVLCVRGTDFELGADLSDAAGVHLELAWSRLLTLCTAPDLVRWRAQVTTTSAPSAVRSASASCAVTPTITAA